MFKGQPRYPAIDDSGSAEVATGGSSAQNTRVAFSDFCCELCKPHSLHEESMKRNRLIYVWEPTSRAVADSTLVLNLIFLDVSRELSLAPPAE